MPTAFPLRGLAVALALVAALVPGRALAGGSDQVLVGPHLSVSLGSGQGSLWDRMGLGLDVAWQRIPSEPRARLPSVGAGGRLEWARFDQLVVAGFFRGGLVRVEDQRGGWYTHGHFPLWSVEGEAGLGLTSRGSFGLALGAGGTASVGALRGSLLLPFVGGDGADPTLHMGLSLPAMWSTGVAIP